MSKATLLWSVRNCLPVGLLVLLMMSCFITAPATIVRYLEIEELARLSTNVIHGEVLSTQTYWDESHTRIYTAIRVQVNESFKGVAKRGTVVTITQLGGELDGRRLDYNGRAQFNRGETVVLFTKTGQKQDLIVVGMKQGKLRVVGDEVVRDFSGLTLIDDLAANKAAANRTAAGASARVQTRMKMSELRQRLAQQ